MSTLPYAAPVPTRAPVAADRPRRLRRLVPAEGWSVLVLHAVVLLAAAWTVELTPLAPPRADLVALALGGMLVGLGLGKLRAPDGLAHLLAFTSGLGVAAWLAAARIAEGNELEALRWLGEQALEWYGLIVSGRQVEGPELFGVVLGLTVWLVAYTSAWVLYRRGWLATALLLPGVVAFVNLGYARGAVTTPLLVLLAAACVLAARYHGFRREQTWRRSGLVSPPRLPVRFLWAGLTLALVAAVLGWTVPFSAREGLGSTWQRLEEPWRAVQERWDDLLARVGGTSDFGGGSYAAFGDTFRLGGALNLSDEPVMVYRPEGAASGPTYLAGHRYDGYDGHGWATRVDETFEETSAGGGRYSPQMEFARGQGVHLTSEVLTGRSETRGTVEVLAPKGNLLFSRDTYLTAGLQTNVQLSWRQLDDAEFDLSRGDLVGVPLDLQQFARLLQDGTFDPADASPSPLPRDPAHATEVARQAEALANRFLDTSWTVGPDRAVATLVVSGQVPIYDDVEAVYAARGAGEGERTEIASGDEYAVVGLASSASAEELRGASQEYPDWVRDRYLPLPETVTERTRELAAGIAADQPSPFDTAVAIQEFLRGHIAYDENIAPPPADQDVVDYVLFDSRRGYCEYYASAMAVMLRAEGIPARVAAGYFAVPYDREQEGYLYREENAHLWVEAFFPGYGWIPFEPTASRDPLQYGVPGNPPTAEPTPEPAPEPTPEPVATPAPATTAPPPVAPEPQPQSVTGRVLGLVGLLLGALALLGALGAAVVWQWRLRGLSAAGGLWARALRAGGLWGIRPAPTMTPGEYAERLGRAVPAARGPARVVADLYSQEVYAGRAPAPGALSGARAAWAELRRAMLGSVVRRRAREGQG